MWLFAFALYLPSFATLMLTVGVSWSIHLWLGSCVLAGLTGYFLSYLVAPPQLPPVAAGEQGKQGVS